MGLAWAGRRRRVRRWWAGAVIVVVVMVAGCGSSPGGTAPTGQPTPSASPAGGLQPPKGFPDLPAPPGDAPISSTEIKEEALLGQDFIQEHGTTISTSVRYELSHSVRHVLDHYRRELPAAGWQITQDKPPQDGDSPTQQRRSHVLEVEGHGRQAIISAQATDGTTTLHMSTLEVLQGRKPSQNPPVTAMPGWYEQLPQPPPGTRRYRVRITTSVHAPTTYLLEYEPNPQQDTPPDALKAAGLADHYTRRLPGSGWAVEPARERVERPGEQGGVIEHRHVTVRFRGHGAAGDVTATQTTSAAGQRLRTQLSVTLRPARSGSAS